MSFRLFRFGSLAGTAIGLVTAVSAAPASRSACFQFGEQVHLSGEVLRQAFPGRPNYQSIAAGDEREVISVLRLRRAICALAPPDDSLNSPAYKVRTIQLVFLNPPRTVPSMAPFSVAVSGKLFSAHSAHHRTPVLLEVDANSDWQVGKSTRSPACAGQRPRATVKFPCRVHEGFHGIWVSAAALGASASS